MKKILMFLLATVMVIPHGTYLAAEEFTSGEVETVETTVPEPVSLPEAPEVAQAYDQETLESIITPTPVEDEFTQGTAESQDLVNVIEEEGMEDALKKAV